MKNSLLAVATGLALSCGAATAQDQSPPNTTNAPTELQGTPLNKPAVATVPEAATEVAGVPRGSQTSEQVFPKGWVPRWIARGTSGRHRTNSSCRIRAVP